jgi:hypothetical protein
MMETTENLAQVPTPKAPGGRLGFNEIMGIQQPYLTRKADIQSELSKATGEEAQAKQAQQETLAQGKLQSQKDFATVEKGAMQQYQEKIAKEPLPAFIPTKDTAKDIAGLFSLIAVLGSVAGKSNAQRAMGAMNGMLTGYRQGRADLYKKELAEFDKNFKVMQQKHAEFRKEMEDAIKLSTTDKEAGMQAAELAAVKSGSDIVKAQVKKGQLVAAYQTVDDAFKAVNKAAEMAQKERHHAESLAAQKAKKEDKTSGAVAGQIERMNQAMTQVSGAIKNIADLPVTTTGPMFEQKSFSGLFTAPLSALNQKMSADTSQMMQTRLVGVARNLASLETGGAATGLVGLTDSIQSGIAIKPGAKLYVALDKLGEMRRIVDDSARAALASPKYSPEQKALIRENLEIVHQAIPFEQRDVTDALSAGTGKSPKVAKEDRNLTFTQYVNQYGLGQPQQSESSLSDSEKKELEELRNKHGRRAQ